MIGEVHLSVVNFYDSSTGTTRRKKRPVLIVGGPRNNDYTVLPISTITRRENVDATYDIPICGTDRVTLGLDRDSFLRTHKQIPIHRGEITRKLGDMKTDLPDLYIEALAKMDKFQSEIVDSAI